MTLEPRERVEASKRTSPRILAWATLDALKLRSMWSNAGAGVSIDVWGGLAECGGDEGAAE